MSAADPAKADKTDAARRPDRYVFRGLLALLVWLPLPWGSNRAWPIALFGVAVALLCAGWVWLRLRERVAWPRARPDLGWPLAIWLAWLAWVAFSLLPLPQDLLGLLSPQALQVHQAVAAAGGEPRWSLSLVPGRTVAGLLLSISYFLLYLLVVALAQPRERLRLILLTLVVSGLLQGGYGSLMQLSHLEYGFFEHKQFYLGFATGTFVNRNHFAGYLGLCIAAGVGLILSDLGRGGVRTWRQHLRDFINLMFSTKMQVRLALAVMVIGLVLSRSRMGNTAAFAALTICGLGYVILRERSRLPQALLLFLSLMVIDTLIVSRWFGLEKVVQRIEQTDVQTEARSDLFSQLLPVAGEHALTGAGLGSFESVYLPHRPVDVLLRYDHAHNDYLEFLIETGLPGLLLLLSLVGLHALHALRVLLRRQDRLRVGSAFAVLMAILAAAAHATVEFNFQIPAYAASFVALLGLAAASAEESGRSRRRRIVGDDMFTVQPPGARQTDN